MLLLLLTSAVLASHTGYVVPQDKLSVRILSREHFWTSINHIAGCAGGSQQYGDCITSTNAKAAYNQIFFLDGNHPQDPEFDGSYFIQNEQYKWQLVCEPEDYDSKSKSGRLMSTNAMGQTPDQLFTFESQGNGDFKIRETVGLKRYLLPLNDVGAVVCYDSRDQFQLQHYYYMHAESHYWRGRVWTQPSGAGWTQDWDFFAYNSPTPGLVPIYIFENHDDDIFRYKITMDGPDDPQWDLKLTFYAYDHAVEGATAYYVSDASEQATHRYAIFLEEKSSEGWRYLFTFWAFEPHSQPDPINVEKSLIWHLQDVYESTALWDSIITVHNEQSNSDHDAEESIHQEWGYTKTYEKTSAHEIGFSQSMSVSAEREFLGFGMTLEVASEFSWQVSESVSEATTENYVEGRDLKVYVAPGTCVEVLHMKLSQEDAVTSATPACLFQDLYIRDCGICHWSGGMANGYKRETLDKTVHDEDACKTLVQEIRPEADAASWNVKTGQCTATFDSFEIDDSVADVSTCLFGFSGSDNGDEGSIDNHDDDKNARSNGNVRPLAKPLFKVGKAVVDCNGIIRPMDCPKKGVSAESSGVAFADEGKLHTIDQQYHLKETNSDAVLDKEESWMKNERREKADEEVAVAFTKNEKTPLVLNILAAFGFCVTVFGAFRHYTTK